MNVEQLRRVLAEIPGDMPIILEDCQMGWMANAGLYLVPAHIDWRVSVDYLCPRHQDGADNCHVLLITSLGQTDSDVIDLTPKTSQPEVIDVEADVAATSDWLFNSVMRQPDKARPERLETAR